MNPEYCAKCGNRLEAGEAFCGECGWKVDGEVHNEKKASNDEQPSTPQKTSVNEFQRFSKKLSEDTYNLHNKRSGLGLSIVVVLIILVIIIYFVIKMIKG